mgnify:FL=1
MIIMFGLLLGLGSCTGYVAGNRLGSRVFGCMVGCMLVAAGKAVAGKVAGKVAGTVGCRSVEGLWYRRPVGWGLPLLLLSCCYGHDHSLPDSPTAVPPFSFSATI